MNLLLAILKIFADSFVSLLWGLASEETRERIAAGTVERLVKEKTGPILKIIEEYDALVARAKSENRTVTPEERDAIRRKKIAAETDLWNA